MLGERPGPQQRLLEGQWAERAQVPHRFGGTHSLDGAQVERTGQRDRGPALVGQEQSGLRGSHADAPVGPEASV